MQVKKIIQYIVSGFLLFSVSCSYFTHSKKPKIALKALEDVNSYAVVYSRMPIVDYNTFDLVILEGENYSKSEISELKQNHKTVLAYLNVGEIETYRSYFNLVESDWILKKNEDWSDHYFVDPSKNGWGQLLKNNVIPGYLEKGFQGFLFDSVDLASHSRFPEHYSAMAKLINYLHKSFPETIIILNNGEFLLDDVINSVHGLLVEEVFTQRVNDKLIRLRTKEEYFQIINKLKIAKEKWNIPTFILEYFPTKGSLSRKDIFEQSRKYGLIPYITDQYAQKIYDYHANFKADSKNRKWSN